MRCRRTRVTDLESSAGSAEQKFVATAHASSNPPAIGAHDDFMTARRIRVLSAFSRRKAFDLLPSLFGSTVLSFLMRSIIRAKFAQSACLKANRDRRTAAAIRS